MAKWKKISDEKVQNHWKCPDCNEVAIVTPDWYQDYGTPMCSKCEADMEYDFTEIQS